MTKEFPMWIGVLVERRNWLAARIKAKKSVGWDIEYDQREHDALCEAIEFAQERHVVYTWR